ncbi:carboxypeptidase [Christiangramia fulva]|uniref:Carboxypeptidase n=1 Tax=Christiangramia fulva TaxID=2126553 RepID=A0A2R3Z4S8_9FLAO|nr:DUF5686 family protein [Christiangramia fulva]AVR45222.1 carboxypeptidase [Christiangramia fulva]
MRLPVLLLSIFCGFGLYGQSLIKGRIVSAENRKPLPYAKIQISEDRQVLSNIDGSFQFFLDEGSKKINISYIGYQTLTTTVGRATQFLEVALRPKYEQLETVMIPLENSADVIIKKAIAAKAKNDPKKALNGFHYKSYSKFIIDNQDALLQMKADSTAAAMEIVLNEGRAYLSEKVSEHFYSKSGGEQEKVIGMETAGFKKPIYNILFMSINPFSLYDESYQLYKTEYAGPLAKNAFKNYDYRIIDTTETEKPAYVVYFKPKREKVVAGLEGILYLDTQTYAIQKAKAQLLGAIRLEVNHEYEYFPEKKLWFPVSQTTTIQPGTGGKEVAVFGGTIGLGTVQQKPGVVSTIFGSEKISKNLYLNSTEKYYDISLEPATENPVKNASVYIPEEALKKDSIFWQQNRQMEYTQRDQAASKIVDSIIEAGNVKRKLQIQNTMTTGYYPWGYWDVDLTKIFKFSNYEGIRLGFGGKTSDQVSSHFNLNGYTTYGFKDKVWKYGIGTQIYLDDRSDTRLNFYFSRDIQETGSFKYLKGRRTFYILQPRFVNINFYYNYKTYWTSLEHNFAPGLTTEFRISREDIWQIRDYSFQKNDKTYSDYRLGEATISFFWRPFSEFVSTPQGSRLIERHFPQFTGQIEHSFKGFFGGDFNFTRIGLKIEHAIKQIDQSTTEFILEGNIGFGDLPLTHSFHAYPNSPNREKILKRFAVGGNNSFETMYFNEFFSDRLVMLHIRHQFRPFKIGENFQPELVLVSRHAIGDMEHLERHQGIQFNTLEQGYSEFGMELNKIFSGFGLSAAYRYGAYHLPTFTQNLALIFTLQLQL